MPKNYTQRIDSHYSQRVALNPSPPTARTMQALIPIRSSELSGATVPTVDGRELHAFLEVGKAFGAWMQERIEQYGFALGADYLVSEIGIQVPHQGGARNTIRKDYHLTLEMAKELSMVERNAKGKQARAYFIECERKAKAAPDPMQVLNDPAAMRGLLLTYTEKVIKLEGKVAEQAPKVEALELLTEAEGARCLTDAGKVLEIPRDKFIRWLHSLGWIYRRAGNGEWTAHADKERAGYLRVKMTPYVNSKTGETEYAHSVRVTPKGMAKLAILAIAPQAQAA